MRLASLRPPEPARAAPPPAPTARVQRMPEGTGTARLLAWRAPLRGIEAARGSGEPLETGVRGEMEAAFGADFGSVRVHTGTRADALSRSVSARAFATGRDLYFRAGAYRPHTPAGRELLAHELAHVVQQGGQAPPAPEALEVGPAGDASEREAEHAARRVCGGGAAGVEPVAARPALRRAPDEPVSGAAPAAPASKGTPVKIRVWVNSFIPHAQVDGPPGYECFGGDNRTFSNDPAASSRTHQLMEFEAATLAVTADDRRVGATHEVACDTGAEIRHDTAPDTGLVNGPVGKQGSEVSVEFALTAKNPLVPPAPAIDLQGKFRIDPAMRICKFEGSHDGFPGYEAYVSADGAPGDLVYGYDPIPNKQSIYSLYPPMEFKADSDWFHF